MTRELIALLGDERHLERMVATLDDEIRLPAAPLGMGGERFTVSASDRWNFSGYKVEKGVTYEFSVGLNREWLLWNNLAGEEGWFRIVMTFGRPLLRMKRVSALLKRANFAAIIGCVNEDLHHSFIIESGSTWKATQSGELTAFANDLPFRYWNRKEKAYVFIRPVDDVA